MNLTAAIHSKKKFRRPCWDAWCHVVTNNDGIEAVHFVDGRKEQLQAHVDDLIACDYEVEVLYTFNQDELLTAIKQTITTLGYHWTQSQAVSVAKAVIEKLGAK